MRNVFLLFQTIALAIAVFTAAAFAQSPVTITPQFKPDGPLRNPGMGWVLYDDAAGEVANAEAYWLTQDSVARAHASIFYVRWRWSDVEKTEGVYEWDDPDSNFSKLIAGARKRGLRLAFRFYVNPTDNIRQSTPDYVRIACGNENGRWIQGKWSPHLDNAIFQQKFSTFVTAFGAKFDDPAEVEWIDVSSVGMWGEAHGLVLGSNANKASVYSWLLETYAQAFKKVLLGMQFGTEFGQANDISQALEKHDCVLRRDGFGSQWVVNQIAAMKARFPRNAIFAEKAYWNANEAWRNDAVFKNQMKSWADVHRITMEQALDCHANTLDLRTIWDAAEWMKTPELVEQFHRDGGYRIALEKATFQPFLVPGKSWKITHTWRNHAVGVLPNHNKRWGNKYKVAFGLCDATTREPVATWIDRAAEPGDWIKGQGYTQNFSIPAFQTADLAPGAYLLTASIINSREDGGPDLELAMTNETTPAGATILGEFQVLATAPNADWYWDGNANSSFAQSDNFNTSAQAWLVDGLWDNGNASATLSAWPAGDSAIFGGSAISQTITAGTLTVGDLTFGAGPSGAGLSGTAYTISGGDITLSSGILTTNTDTTISSIISNGQLTKSGPGKLTLSGENSYTPGTSIIDGTLSVAKIADAGGSNIGTSGILQIEDGTLEYTGSSTSTTSRSLQVANGPGTFDITQPTGTLSFTGNGGIINNSLTKKGAGTLNLSRIISGAASVTLDGGTLALTGQNTFTGKTTVNRGLLIVQATPAYASGANGSRLGNEVEVNSSGVLRMGDHHQFGWTGTLANLSVNDGGTIDQNSKDQYLATLSLTGDALLLNGTGKYLGLSGGVVSYSGETVFQQTTVATSLKLQDTSGAPVNAVFSVTGSNPAGDLVISGPITSGGSLTKTGNGTLKLTGANTFTGATIIAEGKIIGSGSLTAAVNVKPGGTLVTEANATLATRTLTFDSGGTFIADGRTTATGNVNLTGAKLVVTTAAPTARVILSYTGTRVGNFATVTLPPGREIEYDNVAREIRIVINPNSYAAWIAGIPTNGQSGFGDDANGDGFSNGLVFVLGGNPMINGDTALPVFEPNSTGGMSYSFHRAARARDHSILVAKLSDDLVNWPQSRDILIGASNVSSDPEVEIIALGEYDLITIEIPCIAPSTFMRLEVRER